jgi:sec-independent protein translocase protein TatA
MEGLIILVLILLFFGARRVPQLGRSLGSGIREFRKETAAPGAAPDDEGELERSDDGDGEEEDGTPSARRKPSGG